MEKMIFVVRQAIESDIPFIQEITREAFNTYRENAGVPGTLPALEETYEDVKNDIHSKEFFVALYNNKIIGSVRIEIKPNKTGYLSRFGVSKEFQKNGVGKELMNYVDKRMIELGITDLYLHTASRLLSLVRFYYGKGFYIESTANDRGYIRALLCKEYDTVKVENSDESLYQNKRVV